MKTITITIEETPDGGVKLWSVSPKSACTPQEAMAFEALKPHIVNWMTQAASEAEYSSPTMEVTGENATTIAEEFFEKSKADLEQHKRNKQQ